DCYIYFRNKKRNLSAGFVMYEITYATVMKFCLVILLLFFSFKFLEVNNKIVILTFVLTVIFNVILSMLSYRQKIE
ncbi:MAG: hypothetical protein ACI4M9_00300, partial [Succinivibrio sp.]